MNILAFDTSSKSVAVTFMANNKIVKEYFSNDEKTHSLTLMGLINNIFKETKYSLIDIDYIATTNGPGSFTGLRIGASCGKALAHGLDIPIIPVPTLDAIAYNVFDTLNQDLNCEENFRTFLFAEYGFEEQPLIVPIMDARRNQVYTAYYSVFGNRLERECEYKAIQIADLFCELEEMRKPVIFLGDGAVAFKNEIAGFKMIYKKCSIAKENAILLKAPAVARITSMMLEENRDIAENYDQFPVFYLRPSQAEREYMEKTIVAQ